MAIFAFRTSIFNLQEKTLSGYFVSSPYTWQATWETVCRVSAQIWKSGYFQLTDWWSDARDDKEKLSIQRWCGLWILIWMKRCFPGPDCSGSRRVNKAPKPQEISEVQRTEKDSLLNGGSGRKAQHCWLWLSIYNVGSLLWVCNDDFLKIIKW